MRRIKQVCSPCHSLYRGVTVDYPCQTSKTSRLDSRLITSEWTVPYNIQYKPTVPRTIRKEAKYRCFGFRAPMCTFCLARAHNNAWLTVALYVTHRVLPKFPKSLLCPTCASWKGLQLTCHCCFCQMRGASCEDRGIEL